MKFFSELSVFLLALVLSPGLTHAQYRSEVLADAPVAYWRLGDAGPGAVDETGNGHDGVATDAVTFGDGSLVLPDMDTAVLFAGQGQIATAPFEKMDGGGFSVEFWVRLNSSPGGFVNLVGDAEGEGDFMLMVYAGSGGLVRAHTQTDAGVVAVDSVGVGIGDGGVHHVVSTWNSSTGELVLYLDGAVSATGSNTGLAVNSDNAIFIGRDLREPTPPATIDEAAIYNYPLSAARVAAHFAEVEVPEIDGPMGGAGVRVGESALIGELHYSDTFTIGAGAATAERQSYLPGTFPLPAGVGAVENTYGNPAASWGDGPEPASRWSINTDAVNLPTATAPYPGSSGAGSDTGFTQRGGNGDWGIPYGLTNHFVVQTDYVQQPDRVDITVGGTPGDIFAADNLSVFIRIDNHPALPEVGIFNVVAGEFDTGLESPIGSASQWNNYALRIDVPGDIIEVFANEISLGVLDLATLNGGAYAGILSNAYVGTGGSGNDRQWSDNFQVGTPASEAGALIQITEVSYVAGTGEVSLTWRSRPARRYRIQGSIALGSWFAMVDVVPSGGTSTSTPEPLELNAFFGGSAPSELYFRVVDLGSASP